MSRKLELVQKPDGGVQVVEVLAEFSSPTQEVNVDAAEMFCQSLDNAELRYARQPAHYIEDE